MRDSREAIGDDMRSFVSAYRLARTLDTSDDPALGRRGAAMRATLLDHASLQIRSGVWSSESLALDHRILRDIGRRSPSAAASVFNALDPAKDLSRLGSKRYRRLLLLRRELKGLGGLSEQHVPTAAQLAAVISESTCVELKGWVDLLPGRLCNDLLGLMRDEELAAIVGRSATTPLCAADPSAPACERNRCEQVRSTVRSSDN